MPLVIDNEFVDVDFTKQPQFVFGDLGAARFRDGPVFEDAVPLIDERQWKSEIEKIDAGGGHIERLVTRIYNQKSEGSCVSNATGQAHEICQAIQYGKENVIPLSAISLYKRCGRSPGSGSMLSDNLDEISEVGILPLDTPENKARFAATMPNTGFYTSYPANWKDTAALFKGVERFDIRSVAGLVSASLRGFPIVVGRQGHSICYVRPIYRNGSIAFVYANSWSVDWGFAAGDFDGGFGLDSLSTVRQSASWAFALRSVTAPQLAA